MTPMQYQPCVVEESRAPGGVHDSDGWWWVDGGTVSGSMRVKAGKIIDTDPVFRKLRGTDFDRVRAKYTVEKE